MNLMWGFTFSEAVDPKTRTAIKVDIHDYSKVFLITCSTRSPSPRTVNIDSSFCQGILTRPNPFRCDIRVKSADHAQLIRGEFAQARASFLPFERELVPEDVAYVSESVPVHL